MKKTGLLFIVIVMTILGVNAQKYKILEGTLSGLKGETELNVVFDYTNLKVENSPEKKFVTQQVAEKNKEKKGEGDEWKTAWETTDRTDLYEPRWFNDFNGEASKIGLTAGYDMENANYTATCKAIHIVNIGVAAGPFSQPAEVEMEVVITKTGESTVLARISITKAKTGSYDLGDMFVENRRICSAFGTTGDGLAKCIIKNTKK
ncbi:MAG: hypothetical protein LBK03_00790 [Bacteroidales bacterium]|jgi:hypothetical protein|nr:hypothetical protein [Bacteroidales bacterium]